VPAQSSPASPPAAALTAAEVVHRIRAAIDAVPRERTVDTFLDGNPATPVTGVAVTTMATLDVLHRAAAIGANLLVTHEPLYFNHHGDHVQLEEEQDPVYAAKRAAVAELGLVVWHLHDQLHDVRPDAVDAATAAALGWELDPERAAEGVSVAGIPPTTLGALAHHVADRLGATALRYVGDPQTPVRRVGLDLGFRGVARNRALLRRDDVDVAIIGEGHEWETGEYAVDAVTAGVAAGLIAVGHVPSEQAGMAAAADLVRDAVPELDVTFLATPELFRTL
jgi:putative NIF3 family GTP cyclohydrolase 1 type 2